MTGTRFVVDMPGGGNPFCCGANARSLVALQDHLWYRVDWPVRLFGIIASIPCFVHTLECEMSHGVPGQEPWVAVSGYGTCFCRYCLVDPLWDHRTEWVQCGVFVVDLLPAN